MFTSIYIFLFLDSTES